MTTCSSQIKQIFFLMFCTKGAWGQGLEVGGDTICLQQVIQDLWGEGVG